MKMKRISAAMLATVMALSLAACGAPTANTGASSEDTSDVQISTERIDTDTEQFKPTEGTTASAVTEAPEQTTTATTAPEEPETPVELPVITADPTKLFDNNYIMNGCMAFKCDGKNYIYNITENEMYETEYDASEITVLKGCVAVIGYVDGLNKLEASVVNLKTGEQYADVGPIYSHVWNNGYLTVVKLDKGFSGNTISIGMLNDKGEWVLPLSSEHTICKMENIEKTTDVFQNDKAIVFRGIDLSDYLYDITKDKITELDASNKGAYVCDITDEAVIILEGNDNYLEKGSSIYRYDIATGEKTYITDSFFLEETPSCNPFQKSKDGVYGVLDNDYNLLDYDLSEYNFTIRDHEIKGATKDAIVFHTTGADDNIYIVIQNTNGDFICDPIAYIKREAGSYEAYFSESKIVLNYNKKNDCIIDITTGEITECDDIFDIIGYDDINNLMLVKTNGAYYLADPENPDVLINPFERANG